MRRGQQSLRQRNNQHREGSSTEPRSLGQSGQEMLLEAMPIRWAFVAGIMAKRSWNVGRNGKNHRSPDDPGLAAAQRE